MREWLLFTGIVLIIISFILLSIYFLSNLISNSKTKSTVKTDAAFIGFIGPVPIAFATSKKALIFAIFILLIVIILILIWSLVIKSTL